MWLLLLSLSVLGGSFVVFVFGLLRAARRADEGEERIISLILPTSESCEAVRRQQASWTKIFPDRRNNLARHVG